MGNVCTLTSCRTWKSGPIIVADPFHLRSNPHYWPTENGHLFRTTAKVERYSSIHNGDHSDTAAVAIDRLSD